MIKNHKGKKETSIYTEQTLLFYTITQNKQIF
jgi:hypothetical protein